MAYRYIGNKSRLLEPLLERIQSRVLTGAVVADLMTGTAAVAEALRASGYRVIAADLLTFPVHHAKVRLLMEEPPEFGGLGGWPYRKVLEHLQQLSPERDLFFREYSPSGEPVADCPPRKYFTAENAGQIDAIRLQLTEWNSSGVLTDLQSALLHHDLIMAANNVANIAGTYGHFRSTWSDSAMRPLELRESSFLAGHRTDHVVYQGRAEDLAQGLVADLCYLDPPYMKRQYAANYHILETLARGDEPVPVGLSGLRDWWDQYSDFCSKRLLFDAFRMVIGKMDCPEFLISYSEDGLIPKHTLADLFMEFGDVKITELRHARFRSNGSPLGKHVTEYLFHLLRS